MKTILTVTISFLITHGTFCQEKWGSLDGSIAGSHFALVEACGDSVELSSGVWFERMHITVLGYTHDLAGRMVVGDSVYFKYNLLDNSPASLLYDFSLEVGDTTQITWGEFVVTKVDSEFAAGRDRKRITMANTIDGHEEVWLDEIGKYTSRLFTTGESRKCS